MRLAYMFLFYLIPFWIQAQNILISDEVNLATFSSFEIVGEIDNTTFLFLSNDRKYNIVAFNEQMRQSWDRDIEFDSKRVEVIKTFMMPGDSTFSIFYTSRKKGVNYLMADTYSAGLALEKRDTLQAKPSNFYGFDFFIDWSADKSKVLLIQYLNNNLYHPLVYDMRSREIVLDVGEVDYDVDWAFQEHFIVTNQGEFLYAAVDNYSKKSEGCDIFFHNGSKIVKYELDFSKFINIGEYVSFDNLHRNIVVAGIYTDNRLFRAVGSYFTAIDVNTGNVLRSDRYPFDRSFLIKYDSKRKKPRKGLNDMKLNKIIHLRDGGIVLLGEEQRILSRGAATGNILGLEYNLDEIFIINYNGNGDLMWQDVFPKRQYSYADDANFSSFFVMESSNFLRLILNDYIKPETTVSEFILSGNGTFWRNSVMSTQDLNVMIRFKDGLQISPKKVIFPSELRGRLKLVKFAY